MGRIIPPPAAAGCRRRGGRPSSRTSARRPANGRSRCSAGSSRGTTIPSARIPARRRWRRAFAGWPCHIPSHDSRARHTDPRDRAPPAEEGGEVVEEEREPDLPPVLERKEHLRPPAVENPVFEGRLVGDDLVEHPLVAGKLADKIQDERDILPPGSPKAQSFRHIDDLLLRGLPSPSCFPCDLRRLSPPPRAGRRRGHPRDRSVRILPAGQKNTREASRAGAGAARSYLPAHRRQSPLFARGALDERSLREGCVFERTGDGRLIGHSGPPLPHQEIFAGAFGPIEQGIRLLEDGLELGVLILDEDGADAAAGGQPRLMEGKLAEDPSDLREPLLRLRGADTLLREQQKLVPAEPARRCRARGRRPAAPGPCRKAPDRRPRGRGCR